MAKGYWIARVDVREPDRYQDYVDTARPAFERYGARFLVRGGAVTAMEGEAHERNVVIEFASVEDARACYDSPEYQDAKAIRQAIADAEIVIVEGHDG